MIRRYHYEDGNPAKAYIKQSLLCRLHVLSTRIKLVSTERHDGSFKDGILRGRYPVPLFWKALSHDARLARVFSFKSNEHWLNLSADLLRKALNVTPAESKCENKGIVPTEMELVLEYTQQGASHEVSNIRVIRRKFTMKMEKPAKAYIKQALGSFKDGDGDGDTQFQ
ncbi:hypothetical protein Tco_0750246 [Tanacetum coccineum]|uniref:Uncharacterized protein n=1 Tax=Tanacetum coccineum TaxID=301880 RepID=A0ABQ4Z1P1_9ASTR